MSTADRDPLTAHYAARAAEAERLLAELRAAVETRGVIGQAQGILMERFGLDADRAFGVLRRYSQDGNVKLRHVAEHLVVERQLPGGRSAQAADEDTA